MAKEKKAKQKKPIFKRWWFWVIIVFIIGAATMPDGEEDKASKANEIPTSEPEKKSEEKPAEKSEEKTEGKSEEAYKIGDTVEVGDMQYTINSVEQAAEVGPSIFPTQATATFVVVDLTVKNIGDESVTVDSSFFKLKNDSKTFEADATASMSANQNEDGNITNSFFLEQLNPDVELNGKVVFDVSQETADSEILVLQAQTGYFGTETVNINLSK